VTTQPLTVLIIDDDAGVRELLRRFLVEAGYQVSTAEDGQKGLERIQSEPAPHLVLLDLTMPVMSGMEVLGVLRAHPQWKKIPAIVMSGTSDYSVGQYLHAEALLQKPFNRETLRHAIESALAAGSKT
jgi:CheY-like chemotaxis protein